MPTYEPTPQEIEAFRLGIKWGIILLSWTGEDGLSYVGSRQRPVSESDFMSKIDSGQWDEALANMKNDPSLGSPNRSNNDDN